ncbi:MAG: Lrp/AsnC ligand binding domain-containing protein [Nocardioidaceae bacterium]
MTSAYVLVQTNPGAVEAIVTEMSQLEQVEFVDAVTGPYDAIVAVSGSLEDVEPVRLALSQIDNVTRTLTCPAGAPPA